MGPREERRSPGQPRVAGAPRRPHTRPPCARVCARADLDEEIFSLSASTRCPMSVGARRFSRLGAFIAAVLVPVAAALWWWC